MAQLNNPPPPEGLPLVASIKQGLACQREMAGLVTRPITGPGVSETPGGISILPPPPSGGGKLVPIRLTEPLADCGSAAGVLLTGDPLCDEGKAITVHDRIGVVAVCVLAKSEDDGPPTIPEDCTCYGKPIPGKANEYEAMYFGAGTCCGESSESSEASSGEESGSDSDMSESGSEDPCIQLAVFTGTPTTTNDSTRSGLFPNAVDPSKQWGISGSALLYYDENGCLQAHEAPDDSGESDLCFVTWAGGVPVNICVDVPQYEGSGSGGGGAPAIIGTDEFGDPTITTPGLPEGGNQQTLVYDPETGNWDYGPALPPFPTTGGPVIPVYDPTTGTFSWQGLC